MSKPIVFKKASLLTESFEEVALKKTEEIHGKKSKDLGSDSDEDRKARKKSKKSKVHEEVVPEPDSEEERRVRKAARKEAKRKEREEEERLQKEEEEKIRKAEKKAAKKAKKEAKKKRCESVSDEDQVTTKKQKVNEQSTAEEEVEWQPKQLEKPVFQAQTNTAGRYWKRIDEEAWFDKSVVKDNSHWTAKNGGDNWGAKAATDLIAVRGKGFRKEMQKKKRASWIGGGALESGVNSIVYSDSD